MQNAHCSRVEVAQSYKCPSHRQSRCPEGEVKRSLCASYEIGLYSAVQAGGNAVVSSGPIKMAKEIESKNRNEAPEKRISYL
jgi:hypothetical protein